MTDKEIIIGGVDVARCEFCKPNPLYKIEYACHCRGYMQDNGLHVHLSCEHNPNCYYKQLKRLEQENAELKAENERLKEEVETRDNLIDHFRDEALYRATIASEYQKDKTKLEKILQEIDEVAENAYCLTNYTNKDMADFAKLILQKITKAEEE